MELVEIAPLQNLFSIRSLKPNQYLAVIPGHFHREGTGDPIDIEASLIDLISPRGEPGKMTNTGIGQTIDSLIEGIVTETTSLEIIGGMIEIIGEMIEVEIVGETIEIEIMIETETVEGMITHQGK